MEEHFKNKLKNHRVDWDKEELLGSLQKELSQKPSRIDRRWFLLLPVLFISTCLSLLKVNSSSSSSEKVEEVEHSISSDFNISNIKNNDQTDVAFNETENYKKENHKTKNRIKTNELANFSLDKNNSSKLNRSLSNAEEDSKSKGLNYSTSISYSLNDETSISSFSKESIPEEGSAESIGKISTTTTAATAIANNSNPIATNQKERALIIQVEQLPLLEMTALSNEKESPIKYSEPKIKVIKPEQIAEIKNYFFTSVAGNIGLINRSIHGQNTSQDYTQEIKLNEETINSLLILSTDVRVGYQHQSGWNFETGLTYSRIAETFNFVDTISSEIIEEEYDKAFYYLNSSSDTLFLSGSSTVTSSDIRKVRHNNYHSYFNIPLIVGYRYTYGRVSISGSAGMSYAFANNFKGLESQIVEESNKIVVADPTFNLKNRLGIYLGFDVEYSLSHRTNIFTKMAYQRTPKMSRGVLDQFYHAYSMGFGVKVNIH